MDGALYNDVLMQPAVKFEKSGDFDDLPKLKPIDDEPVKSEEQADAVKFDNFDNFNELSELESKRQELNENLQAINEALSEIDALNEMTPQKEELSEAAVFNLRLCPNERKSTADMNIPKPRRQIGRAHV